MKPEKRYRQKSLEVLESINFGDPATAPTGLIKRCLELCKVPVGNFSASDLRVMIGQQFGLMYLIPLSLEKLQADLLVDAQYYEGDLLSAVLNIDNAFWVENKTYWSQLYELINTRRDELKELKISTIKFDRVKPKKK